MPKVYNVAHRNAPPGSKYIGRGSPGGNPYILNVDGDRDEVCDKFEEYVEANPDVKGRIIRAYRGCNLLCHCKPLRCHGDYILRIANEGEPKRRSD